MKRLYKILALGVLVVMAFSLSGCIFNKGTASELEGIYALEEYFYKSKSGVEYEFEENYEYFILVIRNDARAEVIYKLVGESERKTIHTYTLTYNEQDSKVVDRIKIEDFPQSEYSVEEGKLISNEITTSINFNFYPKREDLVSNEITFNFKEGNERVKYQFTRVKDKVNDRNIERAKKKSNQMILD